MYSFRRKVNGMTYETSECYHSGIRGSARKGDHRGPFRLRRDARARVGELPNGRGAAQQVALEVLDFHHPVAVLQEPAQGGTPQDDRVQLQLARADGEPDSLAVR